MTGSEHTSVTYVFAATSVFCLFFNGFIYLFFEKECVSIVFAMALKLVPRTVNFFTEKWVTLYNNPRNEALVKH